MESRDSILNLTSLVETRNTSAIQCKAMAMQSIVVSLTQFFTKNLITDYAD